MSKTRSEPLNSEIEQSPTPDYRIGDHLKINRRLYYHHGIYLGHGKVLHYAPPAGQSVGDGIGWRQLLGADSKINIIHITTLASFEFHEGTHSSVVPYAQEHCYPPLKVIARAYSRLGENGYNLWGNNCEHFARWCKMPQTKVRQTNLWQAIRDAALLGMGMAASTRHWAAVAAGAGLGALSGALKHWLMHHRLSTVYAEFAAYATALYFSLANGKNPQPLGKAWRHASQCAHEQLPKLALELADEQILFIYDHRPWFGRRHNLWYVTERAIIHPGHGLYLDLHHIAAIRARPGKLQLRNLEGNRISLSVRYGDAAAAAQFLRAAIAAAPLEREALAHGIRGWWARRKQSA